MHPPGWYPDPQSPAQSRWWDGQQWTEHVTPPPGFGGGASPWITDAATPAPPRTGLIVAISLAVVVAVALLALWGIRAVNTAARDAKTVTAPASPTTSKPRTRGSENVPTELERRAKIAGIPVLGSEGSATHTHTLLVITVDGAPAKVPALIGIDSDSQQIAAVHTHDTTGIIHVESPTEGDTYTIGQFLTLADLADDNALCAMYASPGCSVEITVVAPSASQRDTFRNYGSMPDHPVVEAQGRDTRLDQGAVIEIRITTGN